MQHPKTAKPATAETVNGLREVFKAEGPNGFQRSKSNADFQSEAIDFQVAKLQHVFGLARATAAAIAELAFAVAPR